ncbi:RsmB/NOP family class I SAM-dependent RNA methyltransferase [Paenibacillus sp. strain BS8-2]
MKIELPIRFVDKMRDLLGDEFDAFMASYALPRAFGLRINPLKLTATEWGEISFLRDGLRPIPWTREGFYYAEDERPGKHPYYHAGMYYIQEPSAMLPAELLDVQPGHRVLDLCAAPGGKTTQLAGKLAGQGVLVTNDNAKERTKALAKNVELAGVRNAIVLNEEPAAIAKVFTHWFDRILIDAPCSGEGMFRKDDSMIGDWEKHSVQKCSAMQKDILIHAATMLAPGGLMLYSTCTFSPEENETQIAKFLAEHPDFAIEPILQVNGITGGRPEWIYDETAKLAGDTIVASLAGAARLWPHLAAGEGHFVALLRKQGEGLQEKLDCHSSQDDQILRSARNRSEQANARRIGRGKEKDREKGFKGRENHSSRNVIEISPLELWMQFMNEQLCFKPEAAAMIQDYVLVHYGERIYLQPNGVPSLEGLKVVRAGWYVGEAKRNRFVPSQALALGLRGYESVRSLELNMADHEESDRYLRGETLFVNDERMVLSEVAAGKRNGYVLVCVSGHPIGWGKYGSGTLKNELSPGWRRI